MKNYIVGAVVGIAIIVTAFHVWYLYALNSRMLVLENFALQVTQLINQSQVKK